MTQNIHILITGSPGTGKTTLLKNIKNYLLNHGAVVGGVFCPEIKSENKRIGFAITDIMTHEKGTLARKGFNGPKIGSYGVNLEDLNKIGVNALQEATKSADYILVDEIAPMELKSPLFIEAVRDTFNTHKTVIAAIHKRSNHTLIQEIKSRDDVRLFEINSDNRDNIYNKIIKLLDQLMTS